MTRRLPVELSLGLSFLLLPAAIGVAADRPGRSIPAGDTTRERFLKLLDRPRVPLDSREQPPKTEQGLLELHFEFNSEKDQRVPGLLVKSETATGRLPAVIVLHGTGGSKEGMRTLIRRIAGQGLIGVAIDGRYAGERTGGGKPGDTYRAAIFSTWQSGQGFPFFYDTAWDAMRLVDYLQTREDVDPARIGSIGFSKGGVELYLAAAADLRIIAAVPCIGVQSFDWALKNNAWHSRISTIQSAFDSAAHEAGVKSVDATFVRKFYDRVVPGVDGEFDGPSMLPLIAPRPLLVINGDRDDRTPRGGLELCVQATRAAYAKANAADQFEFILQPNTGHAVTPGSLEHALDWLTRHLAKPENARQ